MTKSLQMIYIYLEELPQQSPRSQKFQEDLTEQSHKIIELTDKFSKGTIRRLHYSRSQLYHNSQESCYIAGHLRGSRDAKPSRFQAKREAFDHKGQKSVRPDLSVLKLG